jgi:hypothetical protein
MGHSLEQLGTASLDVMGGLITFASPQDLPEGSSPRNWDVDYIVGSVFTRPGLAPVYAYANFLTITQVVIGSGDRGIFTYTGTMPVGNEGFVLTGFTGPATFLNGQTVYVISVNAMTFTAVVTGPAGTYSNQSGTATSTVGIFVGPNAPTTASDVSTAGVPWSNPQGILSDGTPAAVFTGAATVTAKPTILSQSGSGSAWSNLANITATLPTNTASVIVAPGHDGGSEVVSATGLGFSLPSSATVQGVSAGFNAAASTTGGTIEFVLSSETISSVAVPITPGIGLQPYVAGSSSYTWNSTLTPSVVNATSFGVQVSGTYNNINGGTLTFNVNGLTVTVYYTLPDSDELLAQTFNFVLNPSTGITGIETTFLASSSTGNSSVIVQLTKNGVPVGTPITQALTTTPTVYSLGSNLDLWGTTWLYSDINSLGFGVSYVATGQGITSVSDGDLVVFITPGLTNFNYVKTYIQNNNQINTLALDAAGNIWLENVTSNPGILTLALTGIIPGSFAQSATADGNEYVMFSNLTVGTDRPRIVIPNQQTGALQFEPLSQVGPGAPPTFAATTSSATGALTIVSYVIANDIVTFTFTATGFVPVPLSQYVISGTGNPGLDGSIATVLGTPAPTLTTFSSATGATGATSTGTATPTYNFNISSITQNSGGGQIQFNGQEAIWSAGLGSTAPGNTITLYYGSAGSGENPYIQTTGNGTIIYIGASTALQGLVGTWVVVGHGTGVPPGQGSGSILPYIQITYPTASYQKFASNNGHFQVTLATITTVSPIPNLSASDSIQINGAIPTDWNNNWIIISALNSVIMDITSSQALPGGIAQFSYIVTSLPAIAPMDGQYVTLGGPGGELNNVPTMNTTGVVSDVVGSTSGTFQVAGFPAFTAAQIAAGVVPETGQAVTFGTQFTFDPGAVDVGTTIDPIFGNTTTPGTVTTVGGVIIPIGAGTRQAVCFFITESGFYSPMSPFVVFTTTEDANYITASNIPIGPPNTIARGIAFTEAGQNGVPGANFYIIPVDVIITVGQVITTYTSTIIHDNITSTAKFSFTDEVLLKSEAVDIQGADQFNLIELGSSAWVVPYASRNFYGMQLNKVTNFDNLTFDGGYLSNNPQGVPSQDVVLLGGPYTNLQPLGYPLGVPGVGWTIVNQADQTLLTSPVTGMALYIKNTYAAGVTPSVGMVFQTAFQDQYQVAIIQPNISYSVRVAVSNPSGIANGNLVIDLVNWSATTGFTNAVPPYGQFVVPLSTMTSNVQVFTGELLTTPFTTSVSPLLVLRTWLQNSTFGTDLLIDRIEVFPTLTPYLLAQVYGSYANNPEAIDASDSGGIIDTTSENSQCCYGGFVMHDLLYLLKLNSWYSTEQNPNSEPGGWALKEVSNKVGTCGIHAYDTGEEWAMTACREGIFGFNGGQPVKLTLEVFNLWNCINWDAANTIVLCNDVANKRFYCLVPLPTGTSPEGVPTSTVQWLPYAPYNPLPTTPNVMLMCNYQGLDTAAELFAGPGIHVTMFGSLAAMDMKRKWTIWQIPSPFAAFITQQNGVDMPLYICNGIASSKIYQLETTQLSDDGVSINGLYTTYGHVNAVKAATQPIFGMHTKRYTVLQGTVEGAGVLGVRILPNVINPKYPYSVPVGVKLVSPAMDDFFRPINVKAQRAFLEFSTNAVGSWFHLDKTLLTGKADPWSSLNPTGGMNNGIAS